MAEHRHGSGLAFDLPLDIPRKELESLCRRYGIQRLALFGSILRNDFNDNSDVDVLIEFEENARIGWDIVLIEDELSQLLGRDVDLNTPASLSEYFRDRVLQNARVLYERAG